MTGLFDAHCHWSDLRLARRWDQVSRDLDAIPLRRAVVNGTSLDDWDAVAALAESDHRVIPAFGLHPWRVNDAPAGWLERLRKLLDRFPDAAIGEAGLDRWIEGHDLSAQRRVLLQQLELAASENRAISLHCLRAWGPMREMLEKGPRPERGFHLHGYGGSPEMVREFAAMGGYFSFSAYVMRARKANHREALRAVPEERLLIETDAPDMAPPSAWRDFALAGGDSPSVEALHHPANLVAAYRAAAEVRGVDEENLRGAVARNFERFFPTDPPGS